MSRKFNDNEIKKLKASGFAQGSSNADRLACVLDLLCRFTDETQGLSAREIARVIKECSSEMSPAENTILADLHALAKTNPMGLVIATPKRGDNIGFRVIRKPLSSSEANLISNIIQTSMFLDPAYRKDLSDKVLCFATEKSIDSLGNVLFVDEKLSGRSSNILNSIRNASKAIEQNLYISFRKKMHWMDGTINESQAYEEEPVALVYSYGRYYLETLGGFENKNPIPHFHRLDNLCQVIPKNRPINHQDAINYLRCHVTRDIKERKDMYGSGPTRTLFLKVEGTHAHYVYDQFGHDLVFRHLEKRDDVVIGYTCIKVKLSPTFFRWLFGMEGHIALIEPINQRWAQSFNLSKDYSLQALKEDYAIVVSQYQSLLETALAQIIND